MNKYFANFLALTFFVVAVAQDSEESVEEVVVVGTIEAHRAGHAYILNWIEQSKEN